MQWDHQAVSGSCSGSLCTQRFAKAAPFGSNTGLGMALRILYKILRDSWEMPWHRFTPGLHSVIDPELLRKVFKKEEKSLKLLAMLSVEMHCCVLPKKRLRKVDQESRHSLELCDSMNGKIPAWALCSKVGNIYFRKMFLSFIMSSAKE